MKNLFRKRNGTDPTATEEVFALARREADNLEVPLHLVLRPGSLLAAGKVVEVVQQLLGARQVPRRGSATLAGIGRGFRFDMFPDRFRSRRMS